MTDLKPENTLYDPDLRKAYIIDLGGTVKVASHENLVKFEVKK
jgi:serine/threonine protein kinase